MRGREEEARVPGPVEQARARREGVRHAVLAERALTGQLQEQASSYLLSLLASRLNLLLPDPCGECRPESCPGGPALCALALAERLERDAEVETQGRAQTQNFEVVNKEVANLRTEVHANQVYQEDMRRITEDFLRSLCDIAKSSDEEIGRVVHDRVRDFKERQRILDADLVNGDPDADSPVLDTAVTNHQSGHNDDARDG